MLPIVRSLVAAALMLCGLIPMQARAQIVDTAAVEQALQQGAILWDARSADSYAKAHIPGAVNFGDAATLFRDPVREEPPSAAVAAQLFGAAGIDFPQRQVIVYTVAGDPFAYYAARMLQYYGGRHGLVYHGGIDAWKAAGKPLTAAPTRLAPVPLFLATEGGGAISTRAVIDLVRAGGAQILDVRTPAEFRGDDVRAIRGGHVAGAVNVPFEQNWVDPATPAKLAAKQVQGRDGMALKPVGELQALYSKLDPERETVVYCQSGVRASQTASVLQSIGFKNVKVYEASWLGYAGVLSAPAEDEVYVNVGALTGQITALQNRVRRLEAEADRRGAPASL
ncbi:MAG: sulfurtransferase [Burkholderiales bacterium]|nr:hypothetical protein [Burkholderiales bacterium]MDE1928671.1 sulfurtransferase [Burkholderiales bacterium]MDE2159629.1 sulfurtransferase [Burkholderiales bacterium]MDE2504468.1 sulfurtransferase [Burkholderiales bacterium]